MQRPCNACMRSPESFAPRARPLLLLLLLLLRAPARLHAPIRRRRRHRRSAAASFHDPSACMQVNAAARCNERAGTRQGRAGSHCDLVRAMHARHSHTVLRASSRERRAGTGGRTTTGPLSQSILAGSIAGSIYAGLLDARGWHDQRSFN
jgi:hypothetical protein